MILAGRPADAPIWQCQSFDALDRRTLYDLLALRVSVFVVEQQCAYQELDGKDFQAWHITGHMSGQLVATTRILTPGASFAGASIGRVVTDPSVRGQRLGEALMRESIRHCRTLFPNDSIQIGAQAHLTGFYRQLGFVVSSDDYLEDGIVHVEMTLASLTSL